MLNYVKLLNFQFDILAITETWLYSNEHDLFEIDNYTSNFVSRDVKKGGGVGLYVNNKYKYKIKENISGSKNICECSNAKVESIFIEIDNNRNKNVIVGCIYNPPDNNIPKFNEYLNTLLTSIDHKPSYICGDFNINLLNHLES